MLQPSSTFRLLLVLLTAVAAPAQLTSGSSAPIAHHTVKRHSLTPPHSQSQTSAFDPAVIYLDAAHGGPDTGTHLNGNALEKDVTLALAIKLRTLLAAQGFRVVMTRSTPADTGSSGSGSGSSGSGVSSGLVDQRIDLANRSHASACLLLHASNGGHGVHLYTSSLTATGQQAHIHAGADETILPWDTSQASSLALSLDLESNLASALNGIRIPLVTGRASISPIDSLVCPAVAIELAPYTPDGQAALDPSDSGYQQHVAQAIATALLFRREHLQNAVTAHAGLSSAAHPATTKPKLPSGSKPAKAPARKSGPVNPKAGPINPPASHLPAHSHVSGPGVRKVPGVTPPAIPASPAPKPQSQGANL